MTLVMPKERFLIRGIRAFSDATIEELMAGTEIHAVPFGEFNHPVYGTVSVTPEVANAFKKNFDENVYGQEIPISFEHFGMDAAKGTKAAGWVKSVRVASDGMHWLVAFTQEAATEIKDKAWKYFSPEWWDTWTDSAKQEFSNVIGGGALTNRPFFKGMIPLNFSEIMASEQWDVEHSEPAIVEPVKEGEKTIDAPGTRGPGIEVTYTDDELSQLEARSMEEFLAKLREALGLKDEVKEEEVLIAASELVAEVKPLREAAAKAGERMTFSEKFPSEFARMQALEESDRKNKAKAFADRYANKRLVEGEGDAAVATPFGFSALTVDNVEKMHLAFSEGKLAQDDIEAVLESLLNTGLVDYSERGTSVAPAGTTSDDPPLAFAEKVASIQAEDKIEYSDAVRLAAEKHPDLFKAYRERFSSRR